MKARARIRSNENFNYWPSFVDIMTIISMVFFFLMLICLASNSEYQKLKSKYEQLPQIVKENERLSKRVQELEKNEQNIDNIAQTRKDLYEAVVKKLQVKLKDNIDFKDGRIEIKSDVLFNTDSYELSSEGIILANQVADAFYDLLQDKSYSSKIESIEVRGHTDNVGGGEYNRNLSTERAVSFVNEMLKDGSKYEAYASKFKASGMSKYEPLSGTVDNQSQSDMDKNRRIEIYIKFVDDDISQAIKNLLDKTKN